MKAAAAAGAALHNGWAILVTVAADGGAPVVLDRRRVELVGSELPSQPHHHEAAELDLAIAEKLVREVKASVLRHARTALSRLASDLGDDHSLAVLALREPRPLPPTLGAIMKSHPATLIADSEMYLAALSAAATEVGTHVVGYPRSGEIDFASNELAVDPDRLEAFVSGLRKTLGPPWQKDHKSAAAAALGALARSRKVRLPDS